MDLRFQHAFTAIISGSTGSGKSLWVDSLIISKELLIRNAPKQIIFYYMSWQKQFDRMPESTIFIKGQPRLDKFLTLTSKFKDKGGSLVILMMLLIK